MGLIALGICLVFMAFIFVSVRIFQINPDFIFKILKYCLIGAFALVISGAAAAIGFRISDRHSGSYSRDLKSVQEIWGGQITQNTPSFRHFYPDTEKYTNEKTGKEETRSVTRASTMGIAEHNIQLNIKKNIRQKGLLKFAGYDLDFKANYKLQNLDPVARNMHFDFALPEGAGNISSVNVMVDQKEYTSDSNYGDGIHYESLLKPGESVNLAISYKARGTDEIRYLLSSQKTEIRKLSVVLNTDFASHLIPERSMVPTQNVQSDNATKITWESERLIPGSDIALLFEIEGNYGALASKLFFYSPLALGLFVMLLLVLTVGRENPLHPMHYLFIMIGFFIFYLLGSYLLSYMNVFVAVFVALFVSSGIMLYYVSLLKKGKELMQSVAISALVFQWFFSLAFFFPEHTGLLITTTSIAAFIYLLKRTAHVEWENKW